MEASTVARTIAMIVNARDDHLAHDGVRMSRHGKVECGKNPVAASSVVLTSGEVHRGRSHR